MATSERVTHWYAHIELDRDRRPVVVTGSAPGMLGAELRLDERLPHQHGCLKRLPERDFCPTEYQAVARLRREIETKRDEAEGTVRSCNAALAAIFDAINSGRVPRDG